MSVFTRALSWTDFKNTTLSKRMPMQLEEHNDRYEIWSGDTAIIYTTTIYKNEVPWAVVDSGYNQSQNDSDLLEFESSYKSTCNKKHSSYVETEVEKNDKIPRYACVIGEYDQNGDCILEIKVPGNLSSLPSRLMILAYFVSDVFGWGDKVNKIEIVDKDNILGAGAGYIVDTLHDVDVPTINQGWYFYPTNSGAGELEVTPSGLFGELTGQLYIRATLKRAQGSSASKVFVNIDWGARLS